MSLRKLLRRDRCSGSSLRQYRRAGLVGLRLHGHELADVSRGQPHAAGELIDALRIAQRSLLEPQLAIDFAEALDLRAFALDAIAVLDGAEMLPGIKHRETEEHDHGSGELHQLARAAWVSNLD